MDYEKEYHLLKNTLNDILRNRRISNPAKASIQNAFSKSCYHCPYMKTKRSDIFCTKLDVNISGNNQMHEKPASCPLLNKN